MASVPRLPAGVPGVRDLVRQVNAQAQWMQQLLEQNARLVGQLPATLRSFNDALERFNQTLARLDRVVGRLEQTSRTVSGPLERMAGAVSDPVALGTLREMPQMLDALRRETVPALRAATDTQAQVAALQSTLDRVTGLLPGTGLLRRMAGDRPRPDPVVTWNRTDDPPDP